MIFDNMFIQNDIIGTALEAASMRNDVIMNNMANSDVPGFKKKAVVFEEYLSSVLDNAGRTGQLDLKKAAPRVVTLHKNYSYRTDENNVDMEAEMTELYKNSIRYDVMADSVISNYKLINSVLTAN